MHQNWFSLLTFLIVLLIGLFHIRTDCVYGMIIRIEEIDSLSLQIGMLFEKLFDPNALWLNFPADILNECCRENDRNECSRK